MHNTTPQTFAKDVYQVPEHLPREDSFDVAQSEDMSTGERFAAIARGYVSEQFAVITETKEFEPSADIAEILHIGAVMQSHRSRYSAGNPLVDIESKSGKFVFPSDPQITQRQFFYMHTQSQEEWFLRQVSPVREKCFTLSYDVTPQRVKKSATYYDALEGREMNVIVTPSDDEVRDLAAAALRYEEYARTTIYREPRTRLRDVARKFTFGRTA